MYCTTFYLQKRAVYRWLSLLLLIGLLLQSFTPLQGREVWDEALLPWLRRRWFGRRRRPGISGLDSLKRRGWVLCCRLGLVAVLLVWSGWSQRWPWSWVLLSLPLADALLSLLPLLWPWVLKMRIYPYLVGGMHALYLLALVVLFSEGVLRPRDGTWSLLVGSCIRVADGAWARGEIKEDGTWCLEMKGHFILTWRPRNFFEERILLVLLRQLRTPQSTPKRPFLRQEWLAEWFGTHQELISRWQRYVREGGLEKLKGEYEGWVLTPEMGQAILDIWVPHFWLSARRCGNDCWPRATSPV